MIAQLEAKQVGIESAMASLQERSDKIGNALDTLVTQLQEHTTAKDNIVQDLEVKRQAMETLYAEFQASLQSDFKSTTEAQLVTIQNTLKQANDLAVQHKSILQLHEEKIARMSPAAGRSGPFGPPGLPPSPNPVKSLINRQKPDNVADFKAWYRKFCQHCARCSSKYPLAEIVFDKVRAQDKPINYLHVGDILILAQNDPRNKDNVMLATTWEHHTADQEIFEALEYCLTDETESVVYDCPKDAGLDFLRLLCRKYNPQYKNVALSYKASIFALANQKCKNVAEVVKRIDTLEKLAQDMCEATGSRPESDLLAEVLVPSLDESCLRELETYQVDGTDDLGTAIKKPIDTGDYHQLREYIWKRQARERTLIPVPATKMDLSAVATPPPAAAASGNENWGNWSDDWGGGCGGCNDDGLIPSPWHEPSPGPWSTVGIGGAGDGFGSMDAVGKTPLECYNCEGIDHPAFKCTSTKGARTCDLPRCPNCKGKGHGVADCPSPGGGRYTPPTGKGNNKGAQKGWCGKAGKGGKGDKGKGKGKGKSGKGFGCPSNY